MNHSTLRAVLLASPGLEGLAADADRLTGHLQALAALLGQFGAGPVTPQATYDLEHKLAGQARALARDLLEGQLNRLEPDDAAHAPSRLCHEGGRYRRRAKPPNTLATLFGPVTLSRFLYEPYEPGEKSSHPLEQRLGVVAGSATPALAERAGLACAGEPQRAALARLAREHDVCWSVKTYRAVTAALAAGLAQQRQPAQVAKVLGWLALAQQGRGRHRVVLAAGRDGVHVPMRDGEYHEGAQATVSVFGRRGKRLGTVYLGRMPEPGQPTLSGQLTDLLRAVLLAWEGPAPRLAYLSDGGWHPADYSRGVLRKRGDPRRPGHKLARERVLDFYHACGYVTQLAEALFGESAEGRARARRMRRLLRGERRGASRVLQSAAYARDRRPLSGARREAYRKAHAYPQRRGRLTDYHGFRRGGPPTGSGVTEAG